MPFSQWSGCYFLSIDPGIEYTGYATYRVNSAGNLQLTFYDTKSPPTSEEDTFERVAAITDFLLALARSKKPAFVFIEKPPDTIYYQGKSSPGMIIARAQNVFKLIGLTYSIISVLRSTQVRVICVEPAKWQERSVKKREGLDIKDWSLKLANSIIAKYSDATPDLHTDRHKNIADAISMGYICYNEGMMN